MSGRYVTTFPSEMLLPTLKTWGKVLPHKGPRVNGKGQRPVNCGPVAIFHKREIRLGSNLLIIYSWDE